MQKEEFLNKVQDYGSLDSKDEALRMTDIFLATLGEWLYRTEARKLAAQLPKEFQDFLFKEKKPEVTRADTVRHPLEEFYNRIKARADIGFNEGVRIAKAVAKVLEEAVSPGEMEDVLQKLPDDFNELFSG